MHRALTNHFLNISLATLMVGTITLTGCSTLKGVIKKDDDIVASAEKGEAAYYQDAQNALEKARYREAIAALNNIRTFYPAGQYAQQALLDLIYAHYQAKDFEAVTTSTADFLRSYPTSKHLDYALYVQGVTNMGGAPQASRLFGLNQSQRDVSYLRLAFADFNMLVTNFPNSIYAADAAQRMTAIYNDFAEHELVAARWYIKRKAYVAAANRAKWVFQYYPQSAGTPEAIAILAYSNEKLGLSDTANQYKTLLQINYPQYLNAQGQVRLDHQKARSVGAKALSAISFGKLGRATDTTHYTSNFEGATYTQAIKNAAELQLPPSSAPVASPSNTKPRIGLGLPPSEAQAGHINDTP